LSICPYKQPDSLQPHRLVASQCSCLRVSLSHCPRRSTLRPSTFPLASPVFSVPFVHLVANECPRRSTFVPRLPLQPSVQLLASISLGRPPSLLCILWPMNALDARPPSLDFLFHLPPQLLSTISHLRREKPVFLPPISSGRSGRPKRRPKERPDCYELVTLAVMTFFMETGIVCGVQQTNSRTNHPQPLIESASTAYLNNQRRIKKISPRSKKSQ